MAVGITSLLVITFAIAALREGKPIPPFQANLLDGKVAVVQVNKGKLSVQIRDKKSLYDFSKG
jgi:hypothetical protein